jgi:hypothetical protein
VTARPGQCRVIQQLAGVIELQRDDRRAIRRRGDARSGRDPHAECAGLALHRVDHHAPAADREPSRNLGVQQQPLGPLPDERRRQLAGIVMKGVDAGQARQHRGRALVGMVGDPGTEVLVARRNPTPQPQPRRDQAEWRGAVNRAVVVEAHAGQLRPRHRRQQIAFAQPGPQAPTLIDRMGAEVRLVRAGVAAGATAERLARLEQLDVHTLLGAADGGGQARDAASDDRDLVHGWTVLAIWPSVQCQL